MQLMRALFLITLLFGSLSGAAAQSAWSGHPQYVVIRSKDEPAEKKTVKEEKEVSTKKSRHAPAPPDEEEYYDDDDDFFDFAPPSEEEMANIFESLSQVFAMNGPGNNPLMPPLQ